MAKSPYTDSVPIPDPVSKPAPKASAPKTVPPKPIKYPDSTPVDDPISKAKGGKISASARADGCAERGKTKGTIVMCGGGMYK